MAANAWSSFTEATVVTIPAEAELAEHVEIDITGTGNEAAAQHIVIEAKPFSKAVVVLRHTGSTVLAQNVEFVVNDEAELNVVSVQQWADDATTPPHTTLSWAATHASSTLWCPSAAIWCA